MSARSTLRSQCRDARAALGATGRARASQAICRHLGESPLLRAAPRVALYWPVGEEVDLRPLLADDRHAHRQFCLPVMQPDKRLRFARYRRGDALHANWYGIPEPVHEAAQEIAAADIGLVCVPLLGFDRAGNRLGQGGGFYDRSFDFLLRREAATPLLLGIGFACQELPTLAREAWDVPLAAVMTEDGLIDCRAR
jgi:5-formyltetrahydrofolate cyclo-ligase